METFKIASCEQKTRRVLFWARKEDQDIRKLSKIIEADYEVFFIFDRERLFKENEAAALLIIDLDEKGSRKSKERIPEETESEGNRGERKGNE